MHVLILGANSDMACAIAEIFAKKERANLYLASRDINSLNRRAADIAIRYSVAVKTFSFDAVDYDSHAAFYQQLAPRPDGVVFAVGLLGDQQRAQRDFTHARSVIESNFLGAISILELVAAEFEHRRAGFVIGISSVAGERGRQSNYIYGSAKAAFTAYLSGLRNRLAPRGVHVLTVLPGFAQTKMTADLQLPTMLTATPNEIASDVYQAWLKHQPILYTKKFWRYLMFAIRSIPERIFMTMKL